MIVKSGHFIWMQGWDKFPEKFRANIQSVIDKNTNWKIYYWDEGSILEELKNSGQEYLDKYNNFKLLHQRVDYARYFLIWKFGGASIDTDIVALKGFDSIPNIDTSDFIVSEKPHSKSINNATILSSRNNPILKYVIDNIDIKPCGEYESDYQCIQRTTGPYAFNKLLKPFKDKIVVLDKSYMEPCSSLDKYCSVKSNTILDHRHELSWLKPWHREAIKMYFEVKHYKYQILIALIIIIILILALKKNNN